MEYSKKARMRPRETERKRESLSIHVLFSDPSHPTRGAALMLNGEMERGGAG